MRIGGETTAFLQLAAEVFELVFVEAAFDEGAGVHAGGSVPLEVYLVAGMAVAGGAEKVVVADLVEGGRRSVSRDMAAEVRIVIGAHDHGHGVPAHDAFDPSLNLAATRIGWLLIAGNGVDVGRIDAEGRADAGFCGVGLELLQELEDLRGRPMGQHVIERFEPLAQFGL